MLRLHQLAYSHPNGFTLFKKLDYSLKPGLTGLTGQNGCGKSTLLKLMMGTLTPSEGSVEVTESLYYVPQHYGQFDHQTIGEVLGIDQPLNALKAILSGDTEEHHFTDLADRWDLENDLSLAFAKWGLQGLTPYTLFGTLSGGMKTKVLLSGLSLHRPTCILLDEPTNHLDTASRQVVYHFLSEFKGLALIVSHDRALLEMMDSILVLDAKGLTSYGGNYTFYLEEMARQKNALQVQLSSKAQSLKDAEAIRRQTLERKQKLDNRGKQKQQKAGLPTILQHTLKNKAENSTAKLSSRHEDKISQLQSELRTLREQDKQSAGMRLVLSPTGLHKGKLLVAGKDLTFQYPDGANELWNAPLNFSLYSGDRWVIQGDNGSGKSTLMDLIQQKLKPSAGALYSAAATVFYLDQDYQLIQNQLSISEQVALYKHPTTLPHEVGIALTRFLFTPDDWHKPCSTLSGGERMRLALCCLYLKKEAADLLLLDEPTNNLDLENLAILTEVIAGFKGTLVVNAHDPLFVAQIGITHALQINEGGKLVPIDRENRDF